MLFSLHPNISFFLLFLRPDYFSNPHYSVPILSQRREAQVTSQVEIRLPSLTSVVSKRQPLCVEQGSAAHFRHKPGLNQ